MAYKIAYHRRVDKFFAHATQKERERIIKHIETIAQNPFTSYTNLSVLTGTLNGFRLRVGNIRVVYELDTKNQIIYIAKINHRGSIYTR